MSALTRTASGNFILENAIKLDKLKEEAKNGEAEKYIISPDNVLSGYKKFVVGKKAEKYLYNGGKIYSSYFEKSDNAKEGEIVLGYDSIGKLVGIYTYLFDKEKNSFYIKPVRLML